MSVPSDFLEEAAKLRTMAGRARRIASQLSTEDDRQRLEQGTGVEGLYSIGRNGEFAHILMEDAYWRTLRRVGQLVSSWGPPMQAEALHHHGV